MGTCRKFKDTGVGVGLTRSQNSIREIGLIWRIGKCLGLKAESSVFAVVISLCGLVLNKVFALCAV